MKPIISLSEKLYLLAIDPEKGGLASTTQTALDYVLVGALFMELYWNKKIRFDARKIVVLSNKGETKLHQLLLDKMSKARRPRSISSWINRFYGLQKRIRNEVENGLEQKQLIKRQARKFMFVRWKKPVICNNADQTNLTSELKDCLIAGTNDEEQLVLLSFIAPAGLLYRLFPDRKQRKNARRRLKNIMAGNRVSAAVADAISAAHALTASIAVSAAVTASSN